MGSSRVESSTETYSKFSQSTSPEVSAALVVQTMRLGWLFFSFGSNKLVKYAWPKKCVPIWFCSTATLRHSLVLLQGSRDSERGEAMGVMSNFYCRHTTQHSKFALNCSNNQAGRECML